MANFTSKLNLEKPLGTENYDVGVFNSNADKIDTFADAADTQLNEKANKQQEAWITPTLLSGATGTVQYRKNQFGRLEFRGTLTGPAGVSSFDLISGYIPSSNKRMMVVEQDASVMQSILITTMGNMFITVAGANKSLQMSSASLILD